MVVHLVLILAVMYTVQANGGDLPRVPPAGYDLVEGFGYYRQHILFKNWTGAVETCDEEGAHLVIMNSRQEVDALEAHFNYPFTWVGVHRTEDGFFTIFGDTLESTGYTDWYPGQPGGDHTTNPYLSVYDNARGLYAQLAEIRISYVCEAPLE